MVVENVQTDSPMILATTRRVIRCCLETQGQIKVRISKWLKFEALLHCSHQYRLSHFYKGRKIRIPKLDLLLREIIHKQISFMNIDIKVLKTSANVIINILYIVTMWDLFQECNLGFTVENQSMHFVLLTDKRDKNHRIIQQIQNKHVRKVKNDV